MLAALPFAYRMRTCDRICVSILKRNAPNHGNRSTSSLSYCVNLVKTMDNDNYLCSLLLPENLRATAITLRAFNVEISGISEAATESHLLMLRFKFWENSINDIYEGKTVHHPVLIELLKTVRRHKLSKIYLKRLISARSNQINSTTFKNTTEMEKYADFSNTPIYMLLLEAVGVKDINCDHVASHLGKAQGITNLVRALPFNIRDKIILLPMTTLVNHEVSEENILRHLVEDETLRNIVHEVSTMAYSHLKHARLLQDKVPPEFRSLFLPAIAIESFLSKLELYDFNIFDGRLARKNVALPIKLYVSMLMKKF